MPKTTKKGVEKEDPTRIYELVGLVAGSLSDKDTEKVVDDAKKIIKKAGANITMEDAWPRRELSYPIKKETEASYLVLNLEAPASSLKGLNKNLRLDSKLLRFLIVQMPDDYKYISLTSREAEAAEAKEALAPGLSKPGQSRRPAPARKSSPAPKENKATKVEGKLDDALDNIDKAI